MYEKAKVAFEKYMDQYDRSDKDIALKYYHTYQVVELMAELSFRLNLSKEDIELAKVIGLLHDIGRFEQIKQSGKISDSKSGIDHALYAVDYLIDQNHMSDFGIEKNAKVTSIIVKAIKNHSQLEIEKGLTERELLFAKMIRDMDKVDIYRVMATEYQLEFKASNITKKVLEDFSKNQSIRTDLIKTNSDKVLLYLAFLFDINFDESFDILVSSDNFDLFLSTIEVSEDSEKLWKKVREVSFDYINKGVNIDE